VKAKMTTRAVTADMVKMKTTAKTGMASRLTTTITMKKVMADMAETASAEVTENTNLAST
jgi:hypothetical protein